MTISQELALVVRRYPELRELLEVAKKACDHMGERPWDEYSMAGDKLSAILSPPNIAHLRNLPPPTREGNRGPDAGSDSQV